MQERRIAVGAADVAVRRWSGGERPLVFWPGLNPFGALQLDEVGPLWAARGLDLLSIAPPGIVDAHAFDDLSAYRPTRLADLVVAVADAVGLERFAYVGWSWGASIGVHLAVRHADRLEALVLLDAGHSDIPGDPERSLEDVLAGIGEQHRRYRFETWDAFFAAARESRPRWRHALEAQLRAGMREDDEGFVVARADRRAAAAAAWGLLQEQPSSTHRALGELDVPVLLVGASRNDTSEELERFRAAVPRAEIQTVESGHDLFADAPEETAELVASWLLRQPRVA